MPEADFRIILGPVWSGKLNVDRLSNGLPRLHTQFFQEFVTANGWTGTWNDAVKDCLRDQARTVNNDGKTVFGYPHVPQATATMFVRNTKKRRLTPEFEACFEAWVLHACTKWI